MLPSRSAIARVALLQEQQSASLRAALLVFLISHAVVLVQQQRQGVSTFTTETLHRLRTLQVGAGQCNFDWLLNQALAMLSCALVFSEVFGSVPTALFKLGLHSVDSVSTAW